MAKTTKKQTSSTPTTRPAGKERGRAADKQTAAAAATARAEANEKAEPMAQATGGELKKATAPSDAAAEPAEQLQAEAERAEKATAAEAEQTAEGKKARTRARAKKARGPAKKDRLVQLLRRENGATIEELMAEFGWQAHTCRGAISIAAKRLGVTAERIEKRRYRLPTA